MSLLRLLPRPGHVVQEVPGQNTRRPPFGLREIPRAAVQVGAEAGRLERHEGLRIRGE